MLQHRKEVLEQPSGVGSPTVGFVDETQIVRGTWQIQLLLLLPLLHHHGMDTLWILIALLGCSSLVAALCILGKEKVLSTRFSEK